MSEMMKRMTNMTTRIWAIQAEVPAIPLKPRTAAMIATMRKVMAQLNMMRDWFGRVVESVGMRSQRYHRLAIGRWMGRVGGFVMIAACAVTSARAEDEKNTAVTTALTAAELTDFDANPEPVKTFLTSALALTARGLGYQYGSADPEKGGMDCSGTIYFLLRDAGFDDVPRTASRQYVWARKADEFEAVVSRSKESFELDDLEPGDLLFWTGTYSTDRDPPVTHSMIYLGTAKSDGKMLMFGASDGRSYRGTKQSGVSVFDFKIPQGKPDSYSPGARFVGYARIPGMDDRIAAAADEKAAD